MLALYTNFRQIAIKSIMLKKQGFHSILSYFILLEGLLFFK